MQKADARVQVTLRALALSCGPGLLQPLLSPPTGHPGDRGAAPCLPPVSTGCGRAGPLPAPVPPGPALPGVCGGGGKGTGEADRAGEVTPRTCVPAERHSAEKRGAFRTPFINVLFLKTGESTFLYIIALQQLHRTQTHAPTVAYRRRA